jgi:hypothetical protein
MPEFTSEESAYLTEERDEPNDQNIDDDISFQPCELHVRPVATLLISTPLSYRNVELLTSSTQ